MSDTAQATATDGTDRSDRTDRTGRADRVVVGALLVAVVAIIAGRVFDQAVTAMPLLVIPPAIVALLPVFDRTARRVAAHAGVVVVELAVVGRLAGAGRASTFVDATLRGWSRTVSTTWPSPPRPDLVIFVASTVVLATIATVELARSGRFRALVLLPSTLLAIVLVALAAPAGVVPAAWWAAWAIAGLLVLLVADGHPSARERLRRAWAERRPVVAVAALVVVGTAGVATVDLGERADPRNDRSGDLASVETLNPLAAVVAERRTSPPIELLQIADAPSDRWRIFALENYDGVSWSVDPVFGPIGRQLSPAVDDAPTYGVDVEVLRRRLDWLPVAGEVTAIDRDVLADPDRSMFRFDTAVPPSTKVHVELAVPDPDDEEHTFTLAPPDAGDDGAPVADDSADGAASGSGSGSGDASTGSDDGADADAADLAERLRPTAIGLAGQATGAEALNNIATALRTQYRLDPAVPSGSNVGILEAMLSSSKTGTEEQYVSAFVLLAKALGARARVAVGYVLPSSTSDVITTEQARAWPEVWSDDDGWVTFDVVPTDLSAAPPEPLTEFDGRAATPPPPPPPPVTTPQEEPPAATETVSSTGLLDRIMSTAVVASGSLVVVTGVLGTVVGAIVLAKRRRRRRRLTSQHTSSRVIGAWAEATDSLVDHGASFEPHHTNLDIARAGTTVAGQEAGEPLTALALLANQAAHGRDDPDDMAVSYSVRLLGQVEQAIALRHTRWQRLAALVTARSLRRHTRSPVR